MGTWSRSVPSWNNIIIGIGVLVLFDFNDCLSLMIRFASLHSSSFAIAHGSGVVRFNIVLDLGLKQFIGTSSEARMMNEVNHDLVLI